MKNLIVLASLVMFGCGKEDSSQDKGLGRRVLNLFEKMRIEDHIKEVEGTVTTIISEANSPAELNKLVRKLGDSIWKVKSHYVKKARFATGSRGDSSSYMYSYNSWAAVTEVDIGMIQMEKKDLLEKSSYAQKTLDKIKSKLKDMHAYHETDKIPAGTTQLNPVGST